MRYTIVMGCNESREKISISLSSFSFTKSPLPLHIYPHVNDSNPYTLKTTPKSSPTASSTASSTTSPTVSLTGSLASSPTNTTTVATRSISRLTSIAHFKFPMFREFPKNVQTEILHHIDKELKTQ